jgi:hypothetical protein
VTIEEFVTTLEAINKYVVVNDVPLLPAFQVIQQFKTLPDFLMFPVFLALRHHHPTSVIPESLLLPDREIIHAMYAFERFANEAQERSQSASDALKYACHNWAVHLSRAPKPWDDKVNRIFQAFWTDHIIPWLEMEWCLKGLRSCLDILSEGQKLAKFSHAQVEPVNAQPNTGLSAFDPDFHHSTTEASTPMSTFEMSTRGPSISATMLLTEEPVITSHARPVPNPRLSTQLPPSTSPLASPLRPVPSPKPNTAVLHIGTSRKRMLDDLRINSDSQLELDTPSSSKRRR